MSFFKGPYLRVLTPKTTDGINLLYNDDNEVEYEEQHLPLSARTWLEQKNLKLPNQLRKVIEVVGDEKDVPVQVKKNTVSMPPPPRTVPSGKGKGGTTKKAAQAAVNETPDNDTTT